MQCFIAAATVAEERKLRAIPATDFMLQMNDKSTRPTGAALFGCGFWRSMRP
jgi:hypothetical protein